MMQKMNLVVGVTAIIVLFSMFTLLDFFSAQEDPASIGCSTNSSTSSMYTPDALLSRIKNEAPQRTNPLTHFPGRFKKRSYDNLTVDVFYAENENSLPYVRTDCAPLLVCRYSDASWHEKSHASFAHFKNAKKTPNKIAITSEMPYWPHVAGQLPPVDELAGYALTDLRSDVPLSYNKPIAEYYKQPKSSTISKWKVLYIQSNCRYVMSGRSIYIEKLIERGLVDSYGKCNNNAQWPEEFDGINRGTAKAKMIEKYAFVAAFENSYYPGYLTEKIWEPLWHGVVPIQLGAPGAKMILPKDAAIYVEDFLTVDALAEFIEYLIRNRTAYDMYHAWRGTAPPKELLDTWQFNNQSFDCRLCRWGAENLY